MKGNKIMAINERIENALNIVESEVARTHGLESPVTRNVFEATELIRADLADGFAEVPKEEKESWTIEKLAALSDEERIEVIDGMSEEEVNAIFEKMIEEDPFAVLLTAFAASMGDLQ